MREKMKPKKSKIVFYLKSRRKAAFTCEVEDDADQVMDNLLKELESDSKTISIGGACFSKDDFSHFFLTGC